MLERGWTGVYAMGTRPEARRRGAATSILRALAQWAHDRGAARMYLQVETTNDGARQLYTRAGFETAYRERRNLSDAIQAGILRVKLERLPEWNLERRESAGRYNRLFEPVTDLVTVPHEPERARSVYHVYAIRVRGRRARVGGRRLPPPGRARHDVLRC